MFLEEFECAIATLEESVSDREHNLVRRMLATRELEQAARHGRLVLRVLDGLVRRAVGSNAALLRGWQAARLIPRTLVRENRPNVA